jgi:hypothetical protein
MVGNQTLPDVARPARLARIEQKGLAVSEVVACDRADEKQAVSTSQIDTYSLTKLPRRRPVTPHNIQEMRP